MIEALRVICSYCGMKPKTAVILGSGLGDFADTLTDKIKIPTTRIPEYPQSTVEGHRGFLVFGSFSGIPVLAVQGRTHFYEGYSASKTSFIVDLINAIGIKLLLVTNAAGAVNERFSPGDLMLISDHINLMFANPLTAETAVKQRRVDFYKRSYFDKIEKIALNRKIALRRGVLCASSGPSYETAAEVKMIRNFGGDAVSMSTVPEVIAANNYGIDVIGISCITNYATGVSAKKLSHQEVTDTANRVKEKFTDLIGEIIKKIPI